MVRIRGFHCHDCSRKLLQRSHKLCGIAKNKYITPIFNNIVVILLVLLLLLLLSRFSRV